MFRLNNPDLEWNIEAQYEMLRVRFFSLLTAFVGFISIVAIVASATEQYRATSGPALPLMLLITTIVTLYFLAQQRFVTILINLILLTMVATFWIHPNIFPVIAMAFVTVNLGSIFAGNTAFMLILVAGLFRMIGLGISESTFDGTNTLQVPMLAALILALALVTSSLMLRYFLRIVRNMALRAGRSTTLLENAAEVSEMFSSITERKVLLNRFVAHVVQHFDYKYVQVFLLDAENSTLTLEACGGGIPNLSFQPGDSLSLNQNSALARTARTGDEVNLINVRAIAGEYLIPDARSRLILPILQNDKVVGVCDVQRSTGKSFEEIDVQVIRLLLMQLGGALHIIELNKAQQASVQENKRLFIEAQTNLREIQRLNQELTRHAWDQYLAEEERYNAVEVSGRGLNHQFDWTPQMIEASRQRRPIYSADASVIAVPVILRGEVLGVVEVQVQADLHGHQEALDIVQAVSQRLAISLDNARLFEEAQRSTLQEQQINMIASEFETATSVDDLLQIALSELGAALGAQSGQIRLAQPAFEGRSNGSHEEISS